MSVESRRRSVVCASPRGLHRMAYTEWGDARNPQVLVCVHGLTRSGRDFERLARELATHYRVVCPDLAGRGDSDWLPDASLYAPPQYMSDLVTLVARLDVAQVHWVGTSLGGIVGILLAAQKHTPIGKLVLNDIGPAIAHAALERIGEYVGHAPTFARIEEAEAYLRNIAAPFGAHSDAEWRFLTENVVVAAPEGGLRMHYDPALGDAFRAGMPEGDLEFWELYDAIRCPTLVLRGENSDVLARETFARMAERGPKAERVEVPGVGHAPTLLHADQIAPVRDFLLAPGP